MRENWGLHPMRSPSTAPMQTCRSLRSLPEPSVTPKRNLLIGRRWSVSSGRGSMHGRQT
jgi:hypothetical protein